MVRVIPVIDIRGGLAVSGRSGDRENYLPLKTVFADSPDPVKIARGLPYPGLYVADLDGIQFGTPDLKTLQELSTIKHLYVDLGVRNIRDLDIFNRLDCDMVLGTETLANPEVLEKALELFNKRVIVSIDIIHGGVLSSFLEMDPVKAYLQVISMGVEKVLFLNISSVGTGRLEIPFIKDLNKLGEILLGGGIAEEDLQTLEKAQVDAVLVGTALHNGHFKGKIS